MDKQARGGEDERGGSRIHISSEGAYNGGTDHVCGIHDRLRNRSRTTLVGIHLEGVPKIRTERGQRRVGQRASTYGRTKRRDTNQGDPPHS
eukprot:5026977-Pleurochrysis_carterae.AAC.1